MKKTEIVLLIFCISGTILKIFNIAGGGIFTAITFLCLALFYLIFAYFLFEDIPFSKLLYKESYRKTTFFKLSGGVLAGAAISMMVVASAFYIQNWRAANIIMLMALTSLLPVMIASTITYSTKKTPFTYQRFIRVMLFTVTASLIYFYVPYNR